MEATLLIIAAALGIVALIGWLSRNKLADQLDAARQDVARIREDLAAARKTAERSSEEKKGRSGELASSREKLRDAKKRLHDASEEMKRSRELASARAEELRQVEQQLAMVREENSQLSEDLRRRESEGDRPRRPQAPVAAAPAPAPVPVELSEAQIDARLASMGREVEAAQARVREAEDRMREAERRAHEARRLSEQSQDEMKRARGKAEANNRVYLVTKGEAEIWKAKFGSLEQRWNELWRELEGIGWKPRTARDLGPKADAATGEGRRRGPRRDRAAAGRGRGPRADRPADPVGTHVDAEASGPAAASGGEPAASAGTEAYPGAAAPAETPETVAGTSDVVAEAPRELHPAGAAEEHEAAAPNEPEPLRLAVGAETPPSPQSEPDPSP